MLSRQAWRLLSNTDTLCSQVLRAKYAPNGDILKCRPKDGISYTWHSILKRIELLNEGVIWRAGNGESVNIWNDPWIPHGHTRRPVTRRDGSLLTQVSDLIDPVSGMWDETLVKGTFWDLDAQEILKLRVNHELEDNLAWHFDKRGIFSVKAVHRRENEFGRDASGSCVDSGLDNVFRWDKIWSLEIPNKVRMFVCRLAHNSLSVHRNLARRGMKETICPMCNKLDEDCSHLFLKCKQVKECWKIINLEEYRKLLLLCRSGKEMIQKIWTLPSPIQINIIVLLWRWWSARNKVNTGGVRPKGTEVASLVTFYVQDFEKLRKNKGRITQASNVRWEAPPEGIYKINIDTDFLLLLEVEVGVSRQEIMKAFTSKEDVVTFRMWPTHYKEEPWLPFVLCREQHNSDMSMILLETDATELKRALTTTD
jgi:hypothetical protein